MRALSIRISVVAAVVAIAPGASMETNHAQAQTQAQQCKKSKALPNPNAHMSISAWRRGQRPKTWSSDTYWCGDFGTFAAVRRAGSWQWTGGYQLFGIRVNTEDDGSKGIPLIQWIPRNTYKVVVVITQHGFGSNPVGGMGKAKRSKPNTAPRPPSTTTTPRLRRRKRTRRIPSVSARGLDKRRTEAAEASQTAPHATTADARRSPTADPTFDNPQGRSTKSKNKHHAGAGSDTGRPDGDYSGQVGGKPRELGGVADAYGSTLTGQSFGDKEGATGGEGSSGDAGARGAFALFGGILDVPRAYRAAVEVALIAGEALNAESAFTKVFGKGVQRMTVIGVRHRIRRQARDFATVEVRRLRKQFKDELDAMSTAERQKLLKSTHQYKQRQYFEKVEEGARNKRVGIEKQLRKKPDDPALTRDLDDARKIEDAAAVKPVEGRLPLNHEYAGKVYKTSDIDSVKHPNAIKAIEDKGLTGVQFTRAGFPDFTPWTYYHGQVPVDVWIKYSGKRSIDYRLARDQMRKQLGDPTWKVPPGYTWHHHEDVGRMILVPTALHDAIGHTGGVPFYRMTTGVYDAYKRS